MKNHYLLQLELNLKNHMIFLIKQDKKINYQAIGFMVLEDKRRPGTLDDFDYLKHCYKDEKWDDFRNFISIKVYTFSQMSEVENNDLLLLAETFIEFKPSINLRVDFIIDNSLLKLYEKCLEDVSNMDMTPLYKKLIELDSENIPSLDGFNINSYNHLFQNI